MIEIKDVGLSYRKKRKEGFRSCLPKNKKR